MTFLPRDIFDQIHYEHHQIMRIIDHLDETGANDAEQRRERLWELQNALVPHMAAKEQVFYPLVKDGEGATWHRIKAQEDLVTARDVLDRLLQTPLTDPLFLPRLSILKDLLRDTVSQDELHNFITARLNINDQESVDALGRYNAAEEDRRRQLSASAQRAA